MSTLLSSHRIFFLSIILSSACSVYSGVVSDANSTIDFPHDQAYINTNQPTIVGTLRDENGNPVINETVQILIDGAAVGTTTSDDNGIYRLLLDPGLADGQYELSVFCVESEAIIESNYFTIDTTVPSIDITYPQEGDVVTDTIITIAGTTEANAMVITFLDDDAFGSICYADQYGNWSIDYEVNNGNHTIAAQATNIAGNQSYLSETVQFAVNA